jgi:6-pyruvoyltetrahydropterin/6-carboxytetrahydropterin synthase
MRTRLSRDFRFESAHFLPKVPEGHKCARMHGHSYAVTVTVEGEIDPTTGWLVDFAEIDDRVMPVIRTIDHRVLNEIEGLANPTSELLAVWLWKRIAGVLPGLVEILVAETPTSRCVYRGE